MWQVCSCSLELQGCPSAACLAWSLRTAGLCGSEGEVALKRSVLCCALSVLCREAAVEERHGRWLLPAALCTPLEVGHCIIVAWHHNTSSRVGPFAVWCPVAAVHVPSTTLPAIANTVLRTS